MSDIKVPEGYKQTEVGVIPKDWEVSLLMDITIDMLQGINTAIDKPEYVYAGVPILKANNVIDQVISLDDADQISYKSYLKYNQRYSVKRNDFLFSNIGARLGTGALWESDITATFAWNVMRIIPDPRKVSPKFLAQLINSPKQSEKIQAQQSGSGMGFVPKATMQKLLLPLPKLKEQTAIATALSDVDNLIGSLEKLIAKKEAIKTGTMQQLLTGKTRLPEFANHEDGSPKGFKQTELGRIPEDWGFIPMGKLGTTYGGLSGKSKNDFGLGNSYYVPFTNVMANVVINSNNLEKVVVNETQNLVISNDLLFNGSSETPEEVCLCSMVETNIKYLYLNSFCFGFRSNYKNLYLPIFLAYWFRAEIGRKAVFTLAQGSTRYNISKSQFLKLNIVLPSFKEQTAIATILSDMDAEIQALHQRLEKTKDIKQGMMQQLLTGKVRLVNPSDKSDTQTLASKGELQA